MTDDERKEAERLAAEYDQSVTGVAGLGFIDGYAAACEAWRAKDLPHWADEYWGVKSVADNLDEQLEAERARSVKLTKVSRALLKQLSHVHNSPSYQGVWHVAQMHIGPYQGPKYDLELKELENMLKEYEASK